MADLESARVSEPYKPIPAAQGASLAKSLALPAALFLLWLGVYGLTAFPGPGGRINYGDSVWKQTMPSGCTPHVTGFPQYILLTKLFNQLPPQLPFFRSAAYRITSISVLFGALSVAILYAIGRRLQLGEWAAAWCASIYGASYTFWTQATEAEVYTLNAFFVASVLWLFLRYQSTSRQIYLLGGCLVYALSFGNHVTMILLLPGLLFLLWRHNSTVFRNPKLIAWALGCVVLSLFQYLYLHQAYFKTLGLLEFLDLLTGAGWREKLLLFEAWRLLPDLLWLARLMEKQFTLLGLATAVLGIWHLFRTRRRDLAFFLLISFSYIIFSLGYRIGDIQVYYLPAFLILSLFAGCGLSWLGGRGKWIVSVVGAAILVWQLSLNILLRDIVVRDNPPLENLVELLERTPEGSTLLLSTEPAEAAAFHYTQLAHYVSYTGEFGDIRIEPPEAWPPCPSLSEGRPYRLVTDPENLDSEDVFYLRRYDRASIPLSHHLSLHRKAAEQESDIMVARRRE